MSFESAYLELRRLEGRVYTDEVLAKLPIVPKNHPLYREWTIRRISLERLMGHLRSMNKPLRILDLGCGNGWMSHHLSKLPDSEVLGMDLGEVELEQAARVFSSIKHLRFEKGSIFELEEAPFDVIVMGASVQYFPDLDALVAKLRTLLLPRGEIHIVDSPFYKLNEIEGAKARTRKYYSEAGFGELSAHYHHHAQDRIEALGGQLLYNPKSFFNWIWVRIFRKIDSPFQWWMLPAKGLI